MFTTKLRAAPRPTLSKVAQAFRPPGT